MIRGHRQGGKIGGRHTSVIPAAEKLIDFLQQSDVVDKISIGFITYNIGSGKHAIKVTGRTGNLLIKVRGTASIQEISIYTDTYIAVEKIIKRFAQKNYYLYNNGTKD